LFAPYADRKWYLITSIDDYSRLILYAVLVERETACVKAIINSIGNARENSLVISIK
jgi:hypothetical protein